MDFQTQDLATIGLLIFLEGVLSIDNALALALIARTLPERMQRRALTYGLVGAVVFRILAIGMAGFLMKWVWVKFVGGAYLIYMALAHWLKKKSDAPAEASESKNSGAVNFWKTIVLIELTDIAFAVDSILAAVALSPKIWVVVTGGVIGLIMMRFAANVFIRLLDRFPNFEQTAYLLVFLVGMKLLIDGTNKFVGLTWIDFHSPSSPAFWSFWILTATFIAMGFRQKRETQ